MNATVETESCRFHSDTKLHALRAARQTRQTSAFPTIQCPSQSAAGSTDRAGPANSLPGVRPSGRAVPAFPSLRPPARPLWKPDGPRRGRPDDCRRQRPGPPHVLVEQKTRRSRRRLGEDSEGARTGYPQSGLRQGWPNRTGARAGTPRKPQNRADCEMQQKTAKRSPKLACHAVEPTESGCSSGKRIVTRVGTGPTRPRKTRITGGHGRLRCSYGAVAIGNCDESPIREAHPIAESRRHDPRSLAGACSPAAGAGY